MSRLMLPFIDHAKPVADEVDAIDGDKRDNIIETDADVEGMSSEDTDEWCQAVLNSDGRYRKLTPDELDGVMSLLDKIEKDFESGLHSNQKNFIF